MYHNMVTTLLYSGRRYSSVTDVFHLVVIKLDVGTDGCFLMTCGSGHESPGIGFEDCTVLLRQRKIGTGMVSPIPPARQD